MRLLTSKQIMVLVEPKLHKILSRDLSWGQISVVRYLPRHFIKAKHNCNQVLHHCSKT